MVTYETAGARATITIDEPERRNPLSTATMAELLEHTRAAQADPSVKVIVYTGAGEQGVLGRRRPGIGVRGRPDRSTS